MAWQTEFLNVHYEASVETLGVNGQSPQWLARCSPSAVLPASLVRSFVRLVAKTVAKTASSTSQDSLTKLLGPASVIPKLKLTQVPNVVGDVMLLYSVVLSLKSPSLLEEAYMHIVGEIQVAFNTLLRKAVVKDVVLMDVIADNPHQNWRLEIHDAQVGCGALQCGEPF